MVGKWRSFLPTIHNLEHNEHAPSLEDLLQIAVSCEVSLAGLVCRDLWETTATGLKVEERSVKLPDSEKRIFYEWDAIEKQVVASIDARTAEAPWVMARPVSLCEKQFCLKLGKTVYRLRQAALNLKLSDKAGEYEDLKQRLMDAVKIAVANRHQKGRLSMAKKLGVGVQLSSMTAVNHIFRRYCPPTSNSALVICPSEQTRTASISISNTLALSITAFCRRLSIAGDAVACLA